MPQIDHTLRTLFEAAVRAEPREHCFATWYEQGRWQQRTYAETWDRVRTLSEWFGQHGLRPGASRIALMLPNSPQWVELYLAITGLNGTVVPIDPKLTQSEVHHILSDSGAILLATDPAHLPMIARISPALPDLQRVLITASSPLPEGMRLPVDTLEEALHTVGKEMPLRFWVYNLFSHNYSAAFPLLIHSSTSLGLYFQPRPTLWAGIPFSFIQVSRVSRVTPR